MAVTGFVVPRLMDRELGQATLGVWDFAWTVVSAFALAHLGAGSSVHRDIARHRASGSLAGVRRLGAAATVLNLAAAAGTLLLTAAAVGLVDRLLGAPLAGEIDEARWVVGLLGLTVAVEFGFALYGGVIVACHRFDLQSGIGAGFEVATALATIAALQAGGGLRVLAAVRLAGTLAAAAARVVVAYRVCPELSVRLRDAERGEIRHLLGYGGKSMVGPLSRLFLLQANRLIVASQLGPAALAVYSRPVALIRVVETLANRFAVVLAPTASSLDGAGQHGQVRRLVVQGTRYGMALVLPMALGLAILGDPLVVLWMGPRYRPGAFMAILVLGFLLPLVLRPVLTILVGLDLHGAPAVASLVAAVAGVALALLNVAVLGWGLEGAALAVALPLSVGDGIFLAYYAGRRLGMPLLGAVRDACLVPVACALPFALVLLASRLLLGHRPVVAVAAGSVAGALVLAPLYWRYLASPPLRQQARAILARIPAAARLGR